MSGIFSEALNNDIIGAMFAVSMAFPNITSDMNFTTDEKDLVSQCAQCVAHIKKEGVPRRMMHTDNPKLKVCRHIIQLKNTDKIKKILRKFLQRLQTHPKERASLRRLSEKVRPYIDVPYSASLSEDDWNSEIVYDEKEDLSGEDVMSGISTLSWEEDK